jgi:hypothetical protein
MHLEITRQSWFVRDLWILAGKTLMAECARELACDSNKLLFTDRLRRCLLAVNPHALNNAIGTRWHLPNVRLFPQLKSTFC